MSTPSDLVFTPAQVVKVRTTTVHLPHLLFLRLLGVEEYVLWLERRVVSLESAVYNVDDGHQEVIREIESTPSRLVKPPGAR